MFFCAGGLCFFGAMLFFGFLALEYVSGGAGIVFAGFSVTPGGVVFGAIPFIGFCGVAAFCFLMGVTLCSCGVVPPVRVGVPFDVRAFRFLCGLMKKSGRREPDFKLRCVRCCGFLEGREQICPHCEWPQPYGQ